MHIFIEFGWQHWHGHGVDSPVFMPGWLPVPNGRLIPGLVSHCVNMADDVVVFYKSDLPNLAFPMMEDIRRRGKLCDVTLKVLRINVYDKNKNFNVRCSGHGLWKQEYLQTNNFCSAKESGKKYLLLLY